MRIKQKLKNLWEKVSPVLDKSPIHIGGQHYYTSIVGSVLGLLIIIILIMYTISKFYSSYYSYTNMTVNTQIFQNDPTYVSLTNWQLKLYILGINASNMRQKGIFVTICNVVGNDLYVNQTTMQFNDEGRYLSVNWKQMVYYGVYPHVFGSFKNYQYYQYYGEFAIVVKKLAVVPQQNQFQIVLEAIVETLNPSDIYYDTQYEKINYTTRDYGVLYTKNTSKLPERVNYVVSSMNCTSDHSLLPSFVPRQKTFRQIASLSDKYTEKVQNTTIPNLYREYRFRRSLNSISYTRHPRTVDQLFAGILGMSAIFTLITVTLFRHYNQWGSEQKIISEVKSQPSREGPKNYLLSLIGKIKRSKREQKILKHIKRSYAQLYVDEMKAKMKVQVLQERMLELQKMLKVEGNIQKCKKRVMQNEKKIQELQEQADEQNTIKESLLEKEQQIMISK